MSPIDLEDLIKYVNEKAFEGLMDTDAFSVERAIREWYKEFSINRWYRCDECKKYPELKAELGCSSPIQFLSKDGVKKMDPAKLYDENLNEL